MSVNGGTQFGALSRSPPVVEQASVTGGRARDAGYLEASRRSGLPALGALSLLVILTFLAFLAVDCHGNDCSSRVLPRLGVIGLLTVILGFARLVPDFSVAHYGLVFGVIATVLMMSLAVALPMLSMGNRASASPTMLVALFVLYVFFRLPSSALLAIGLAAAATAFQAGLRMPFDEYAEVRTVVNLLMVNFLGFALARSIENRERRLFEEQERSARQEAQLRERSQIAEQAVADKNRLIAAIGHDLRQPLMAAHLHGEILRHQLTLGDRVGAERQARELVDGLEQLKGSIDQLLLASREDALGAGAVAVVALEPLLRRVSWVFEDECARRGLQLRVSSRDPTLVAHTDGEALFRVLVNLVGNAVKFSRPPGRRPDGRPAVRGIVLQVLARGDRVLIRVADNGIGMAAEELDRVWEAFYQSGPAISRHREGLGLGLYLVRRSLQKLPFHEVRLRSSPGLGTRFTLSMPRVNGNEEVIREVGGGASEDVGAGGSGDSKDSKDVSG